MRRILLGLMLCSGALQAKTKDWMAELRAGAFIPTSGKIQRDFGHAWIEGEIEFDYMFVPHWQVWGNANYFYRHGHSARWDIKTDINIYPVSAGLKYVYAIGWFRPYVGFGPAYTFLHVRNHSHELSELVQRQYKNRWGYVIKSGIYFMLPRHFYLDLFCDYYYQKMNFRTGLVNISGFRAGLGAGYCF